ncbi:MAG TPA: acetyltransferase [Gammaproteobacteria bacterium]|nr:acetyltransferase [Gammaproteobacteria bacterium]
MLLKEKDTGHLVEVLDLKALFDPFAKTFNGRMSFGEDVPEPDQVTKISVEFPSGEHLPKCWLDPHYRD